MVPHLFRNQGATPFPDEFATSLMHRLMDAAGWIRRGVAGRLSLDIGRYGVPQIEIREDWTAGRREVIGFEVVPAMFGKDASEQEIGREFARRILPRAPEFYTADGAGVGIVRNVIKPDHPVPFPA